MTGFRIFWIACSLTAGNCLYQAFHSQDWARALDVSYFQGVAIVAVWLSFKLEDAGAGGR